jgi:hypothetical protein
MHEDDAARHLEELPRALVDATGHVVRSSEARSASRTRLFFARQRYGLSLRDALFPGATNGERINLSISNDQIQQQWERYRIKWQRDKVWKILTPIFVVCVGYKTPLVDRVFHTGEVYELSGKVPGKPGVRVALNFDDGNVSIGVEHLILERSVPQGGYAD